MIMKGSYTADGSEKYIEIPFGATWFEAKNLTQWGTAGAAQVVKASWRENRENLFPGTTAYGTGETKTATTNALVPKTFTATTGIEAFNSGVDNPRGTAITGTAISTAAPPVVTTANTGTLKAGDIVVCQTQTGATQFNGVYFTVGTVNTNTNFQLKYAPTLAAVGTGGTYVPIKFPGLYQPETLTITKITTGTSTVVTTSVVHSFSVGDVVRIVIPEGFGTVEINNTVATVTAVSTTANTVTLDVDSSSATAFSFPATGATITQYAELVPVSPAALNTGKVGLVLQAGAAAAGGAANDIIEWIAGDDSVEIY